jgi:branched-subunit amino acid transport protein AzlD
MSETLSYQLLAILGMGAITLLIRGIPFLRVIPRFVLLRLEKKQAIFPTLFLTLLVIYCLSPVRTASTYEGLLLLGCAAWVAALQWLKGNLILSLGSGTAIYIYLLNR